MYILSIWIGTNAGIVNFPSREIVRANVDPLLPILRQLLDDAAGKAREISPG